MQQLSADGKRGVTDHITLELANRKCHVTSYDAAGQRHHYRDDWVLDVRADCSLSFWFSLFVPFSILREQDHAMNVDVPMPTRDAERRVEEFKKYAASCSVQMLDLVPHGFAGDYLFSPFYLQTGEEFSANGLQINL